MPLNPNISLAYKGIELQNPLDQYGKVMALQSAQQQNALAQRQMQEYDRSLQESEGVRNRLAGGAKIDDPATYNFLMGSKQGREILKQEVELQKERTLQQKTEGELFDQRMKQIRELWGNVQTPEQAMAVHEATHLDPIVGKRLAAWNMTEQSGRQSILDAAKDPSSFAQFVKRAQLGAEKFMELNKPTLSTKDTGGELIDRTYEPLTGKITEVSRTAKVMSPGEKAANARAQAAQNLAERRFAYEQANPGYTVQAQSDGTLVAINNRNPSDVKPVSMGGLQVQGKMPEAVRKEMISIDQQRSAINGALNALKEAPEAFSYKRGIMGKVSESLAGRTETPAQTQARAYIFNNVSAVINERAGAAQSAQELARLNSFLPADTDNAEQVENKLTGFLRYLNDKEAGVKGKPTQLNKPTGTWSVVK